MVFDGRGRNARATLESLEKSSALVEIGPIEIAPQPALHRVIASAIPKGDRLSTMLQMLTQLGVSVWQPLVLEDSAVRKFDSKAARLHRILIESSKVARRAWHLDVMEPLSLDAWLETLDADVVIYFGDREGDNTGLAGLAGLGARAGLVAIGPEAGFSRRERQALDRVGAQAISLGPHNLRIETAAIAAATAFNLASQNTETR
jgi:16S rRNA (uracil1498-N3)-methyltransferase